MLNQVNEEKNVLLKWLLHLTLGASSYLEPFGFRSTLPLATSPCLEHSSGYADVPYSPACEKLFPKHEFPSTSCSIPTSRAFWHTMIYVHGIHIKLCKLSMALHGGGGLASCQSPFIAYVSLIYGNIWWNTYSPMSHQTSQNCWPFHFGAVMFWISCLIQVV